MNLVHLRYFVEVADTGSISKAARNLYVTQPAVSMAIRELENEFECQLLTRNKGKAYLTTAGQYLYKSSKEITRDFDNLKKNMLNFVGKSKFIKVGIPPMLGTFVLPNLLSNYSVEYPNSQIQLLELGSKDVEKAILEQEVSLGFIVIKKDDSLNPDFEYFDILDTELLFTVSSHSAFAKQKSIDFNSLADYPLILMNDGTLQSILVQNAFKERKLVPNIVIKSNQIYTIKQLLLNNDLGAFFFNQVVDNEDELVGIPLSEPIKLKICLIHKSNMHISKDDKAFLDYVLRQVEQKYKKT